MNYIENRSFLVISAKRPLAEWVAEVDNEEVDPVVLEHKAVYLAPPLNNPNPEEVEKLVRRHSAAIFENELFSWYVEREVWPSDRSFATFVEWFSWEYVEEGFDLADGGIEKE
jgi:hypothetical protein